MLPPDVWDSYIEFIQKQGVKGYAGHWYVKRVEQYTRTYSDQKLLTHAPELVTRFLENEGRDTMDSMDRGQFSHCSIHWK